MPAGGAGRPRTASAAPPMRRRPAGAPRSGSFASARAALAAAPAPMEEGLLRRQPACGRGGPGGENRGGQLPRMGWRKRQRRSAGAGQRLSRGGPLQAARRPPTPEPRPLIGRRSPIHSSVQSSPPLPLGKARRVTVPWLRSELPGCVMGGATRPARRHRPLPRGWAAAWNSWLEVQRSWRCGG